MITYLVCDQDALVFQQADAWDAHFIANPAHTSHIGIGGDTSTPSNYASGTATPQVLADPSNPTAGQIWVLATDQGALGTPVGLLLSLTHAANHFMYQLSYRTAENTTIRTVLS